MRKNEDNMPTLKDIASHKEEIEAKAKKLGIKSVQLSEDRNLDDKYYLFLVDTGLETGPELKKVLYSFKHFLQEKFEYYGADVDDITLLKKIAKFYPKKEFYTKKLERIIDIPDYQSLTLQEENKEGDIRLPSEDNIAGSKKRLANSISQNNGFEERFATKKQAVHTGRS